ncbi:selenium metabolism-associated LysR family transcriptional regulator [Alkaliphilus peptidifermentans]|uniref:Transcriptional regulator, LysR family n=1 Tax=Alkaliphilus peptidifermentans DSM 18978 TaxID=1120976 RepID=A0A1G5CRZ9_9FIRM|nr:selenium metabolism-associated LysR family transcriptional regulator [Alkaliphilus peptidifermentans]SCY05233.1 transcriptional regulator, LysR family [Alkaliphilus peptidifermentans DSM 18978]
MDLRQLETFVAVAKFKSFSKAADHLYLTQPTVSSHIANLEKELNTILINRTNRKISLTKAGDILYDYALNILNLKDGAIYKLGEYKGKIVGNIEIASSTIPEQYILPQLFCQFNKEFPDVTFQMLHYDSQQVVEGIIQDRIDFGIVGAEIPHPQLNYVELINDELVLVTPATSTYASFDEEISIEEILNERFIFREIGSGTRKLVESKLADFKFDISSLNVVAYIENTEAIKQCIRSGLGVSFLSQKAITDELKAGSLKSFKIKDLNLERKFYFVYHKYRNPSPLESTFQNFVFNYFQKANASD